MLENYVDNCIILTHFPVITNVSHPDYKNSKHIIKKYFENDIKLDKNNLLYIHGHTHYSMDKEENGIRYVSNQLGYKREEKLTGAFSC